MSGIQFCTVLNRLLWHAQVVVFAVFLVSGPLAQARQTDNSPTALSQALLKRAEDDLKRIQPLVADGTLPKTKLAEAQANVDDARDQEILMETLYSQAQVKDLSSEDAGRMLVAAQRRVDRQAKIVAQRQNLLSLGILSRSELSGLQSELEDRQRVLSLAQNRAKLVEDLKRMAALEAQMLEASHAASKLGDVMYRYDGSGVFRLDQIAQISTKFQDKFHRPLPISAYGQTVTHASMGLDHRGRVDVALTPDSVEGLWLRRLLENMRIPYLAFKGALAGAATGPHIHIGLGSSRLAIAAIKTAPYRG